MGLFNTVKADLTCRHCGRIERFTIQFKYGEVYQHYYQMGDALLWGAPDVGTPGQKLVVADAVAEDCPHCGAEGDDCEVWLQNDVITEVRLTSHQYDSFFLEDMKGYHVLM